MVNDYNRKLKSLRAKTAFAKAFAALMLAFAAFLVASPTLALRAQLFAFLLYALVSLVRDWCR